MDRLGKDINSYKKLDDNIRDIIGYFIYDNINFNMGVETHDKIWEKVKNDIGVNIRRKINLDLGYDWK